MDVESVSPNVPTEVETTDPVMIPIPDPTSVSSYVRIYPNVVEDLRPGDLGTYEDAGMLVYVFLEQPKADHPFKGFEAGFYKVVTLIYRNSDLRYNPKWDWNPVFLRYVPEAAEVACLSNT